MTLRMRDASAPSERGAGGGCDVVEIHDRAGFLRLEKDWNRLVEATTDLPFYRHEFIRGWIDSFMPGSTLKILAGRDRSGRLVAALPLVAERGFLYGLPVRRLVSPTNVHSCRFDLIAFDRETASRKFFRALVGDDSWDVVRITDVPAGGNAWDLYRVATDAGYPAGAWESQRSPYIPLPPSYEVLEARLSAKFRANLRRRRKRLEERGRISIERVTGGVTLERRLDECFALERSGWKGRNKSAAAQSRRTRAFYTDLAQRAAREGSFSLWFLLLDGRPIAAQYGLTRRGVYNLVLTCYDEDYGEYGPGHLLTEDVMKQCVAEGLSEFDFLGCDLGWKLDWSPITRAHHWFFIFRDTRLGRTLQKAKFGWIPAAKESLRKWRQEHGADTEVALSS